MAKAKKPTDSYEDDTAAPATSTKPAAATQKKLSPAEAKKLVTAAVKAYKRDAEAERELRKAYREDMLFTFKPGEQADPGLKAELGKDRIVYEFNEVRPKCMTVINHIRANRPAAKIRGVEENDVQMAEIRQGLYLNITNNSRFDSIKDYAAAHQVAGGFAVWRIDTEYSSDTAFDQDIVIRSGINPLCYLADSRDKDELKCNAKHWFVHTKIPNDEYEAKYPTAERTSFEPDEELEDAVNDDDSTWVAEYWVKKPHTMTVCLLSDGKTVDKATIQALPEGVTIVKERKVNTHKICQYIISSSAVLEGPNEWAGPDFPFVPVYGFYVIIDGKPFWCGLTRYLKDAQRAHNWAMTNVFEAIGNAPKAKDWATPKQALGHTAQWAEAHQKNFPVMLYNPDSEAPGPPAQRPGGEVPVAMITGAQMSSASLNTLSSITLANEGRTSNETSGKAIRARQDEGMVGTFNFGDNMAKAEQRTCEIVNRLMPKIYDTERNIRVLGKDGAEKYLKINARDAVTGEVMNDISAGKFDYTVTTGPSYATQRQEAAEFFTQFSAGNPQVGLAAGDLIVKAQDYPMAEAISERLKLMLPPQILAAISEDKPIPPEVQAAMQQVQQLQQQVTQQGQLVQAAQVELQGEKATADKAKSDVQIAQANLKVQEANLAKEVVTFQKLVSDTQLKMAELEKLEAEVENEEATNEQQVSDKQQLTAQISDELKQVKQQAADILSSYAQQLIHLQAQMSQQQPERPRIVAIHRVNGVQVPQYSDQQGPMQPSAQPMQPPNGAM